MKHFAFFDLAGQFARTILGCGRDLRLFLFGILVITSQSHAQIVITEFLARNDGLLQDEDQESPDWIEIHNDSVRSVNLGGWHLTDDPDDLTKWTFPSRTIPADGYLVVFASGKDRAISGQPLHANFSLSDDGEYLALVRPDGLAVAQEFSPAYPAQRYNVSYGEAVTSLTQTLIDGQSASRVLVPTDGSLGQTWTDIGFQDDSWQELDLPAGFGTSTGLTTVLAVDFNDRSANINSTTYPGFSSFIINAAGGPNEIQEAATTRVFGDITVTVSSSTPQYGYDDRLRDTPLNSGAFTESLILRDFIFSRDNTGTQGLDVLISGLAPNTDFRFSLWGFDSINSNVRVSNWYANGTQVVSEYTFSGTTFPASNEDYQFSFETTSNAAGEILLEGRRVQTSTSLAVFLNALKIDRISVVPSESDLANDMVGNNASVFIRIPFTVDDPGAFESLELRVDYDDGFQAYINGQLVGSRNAPGPLQWNSSATASTENYDTAMITIANPATILSAGENVLAIHGLNASASDTDFFIDVELTGSSGEVLAGRYYSPPSPGLPNGNGFSGIVADTKFSVDRGFYEEPFSVEITTATEGAAIYWTTDGSIPAPSDGTLYSGPVPVSTTTLLRAAAFLDDYIPSIPDAQTYIFLDEVLQQSNAQPGHPTTWQADFPADYGMDPNIVNDPGYGPTLKDDLRSIPTLSLVSDHDSFWHPNTGIYVDAVNDRGERAVSAELFNGDNTSEFQINSAIQMHGQAGRDNVRTPKHSFRLEFKNGYGPSRLDHDIFDGGVTVFDSLILRNSWADTWTTRYDPFSGGSFPWDDDYPLRYRPENASYLRDLWVKEAMRDMGHLASRGRYVHLYVNGLYWGIYAIIERMDTAYFANHLGGLEKDWDILKDYNELQDGSRADWDALINLVNQGINSEADFQAVAAQVDIDNLIDYFLLHALVEANDWLQDSNPHNWYGAHRRANPVNGLPETKWVFLPWDQEIAFNRLRNDDRVNGLEDDEPLPSRIYNELRTWPEFRRMYADRAQKQMFNGGALSPSSNIARLEAMAAEIDRAIVGESARWGDAREFEINGNPGTGETLTRDEWWVPELEKLTTDWFLNEMHQRTLDRLRAADLFPTTDAPVFNQFGGAVSDSFQLTIPNPNVGGVIYFTTDGSDPRNYGSGTVSSGAQTYDAPLTFNGPTTVSARVFNDVEWSALVQADFFPPQDLSKLTLTEIMYNPPDRDAFDGNDLEFLELKNNGENTLDISSLLFTEGIDFTFPSNSLLGPDEFFVLARDAVAFADKYPGVTINGVYSGQLNNAGETLTLSHPLGNDVFSVTYDDSPPWPVAPDILDFSLVQRDQEISQAPDGGSRWRASANAGGSPGADDPEPVVPAIVINEILPHTDPPLSDSIELFNPTDADVNIGGWYLTDTTTVPAKFRIPDGTVIGANGYVVFDESDFNPAPGTGNSFALSSEGDELHLFSATSGGQITGYSHSVVFGGSFNGVSFGRLINSVGGEFFPQQNGLTPGTENSGPQIGPVIISEIHYNPALNEDEFIELLNTTGSAVPLYNTAFPANTWEIGGITFSFPQNVTLGPYQMLLVVQADPETFRVKYGIPQSIGIFGPYTGQLQNSGENLELRAPDNPNMDVVPYVVMDAVRYGDSSPWPPAADGSGSSLQRISPVSFGNEPLSWTAAAPTPGASVNAGDSDNDGMPDVWEELYPGMKPLVNDADEDLDKDGMTNLDEYRAGTIPNDPDSGLWFTVVSVDEGEISLEFEAAPNISYSLLYKTSLDDPDWIKAQDIAAQPGGGTITLDEQFFPDLDARFYLIVTPSQGE